MSNLKERNEKVIKKVLTESQEIKAMREGFKKRFGVEMLDGEKFPVMKEGFSFTKAMSKISLKEADAASAFTQFLRAGVQTITNAAYEATPTTYQDWVTVVQSTKDTELYAPNHGVAFPRQVGPSEVYPEVGAAALDIKLQNRKFGAVFAIQKELLDDDQTGSFQKQAAILGEYMKVLTEVLVMGKLASVSGMKYIDYSIPVSETQPSTESTYPWSTGLVGGGANRPSSFSALTPSSLQAGFIGLMNQKNLQGIKMMVDPDRLLVGPQLHLDAATILNSAYYPAGAAAAGALTGAFAVNVLKGKADLTISRFMFKNDGTVAGDSKAWYLMDSKKPWFVLQMREASTVVQENPQSGMSFERDEIRFKAHCRMNADHIDPRFAWQGNDGSV